MCFLRLFVPISRLRFLFGMPVFFYDTDMNVSPKIVHSRGWDSCETPSHILGLCFRSPLAKGIIWSGDAINLSLHYFNASRLNFGFVYWKLRRKQTKIAFGSSMKMSGEIKHPKVEHRLGNQRRLSDVMVVNYGGVNLIKIPNFRR